ncbi:MAG TPA: NERD domain-containing protein [Candidatus Salinicoccus stercoripullorum]|uniref:NERD domain-containing protein n=1 Tax=Candidatus Salinicoccus stercoripullorum TaxID=2838756 RepID=A0A9D1QH81_9STAP|nr:NERD domain-containing protein [Candidatus Salinicoccus stercoripullorum]
MSNLARGFAGEAEYDRLFDVAGHGRLLIYRDVWMKVDKAVLQADSLIVTGGVIVVNGIKNYSGSHLYQSGWSARENAALRKYFIADPMPLPETDPHVCGLEIIAAAAGVLKWSMGSLK